LAVPWNPSERGERALNPRVGVFTGDFHLYELVAESGRLIA
jgi:hypothetical protein